MKQALTLTPTADALDLEPFFAGAPALIYGDVPDYPAMNTWIMQLWKRPHDAAVDGAEPLATAVGSESSGVMTIGFTAAQLSALDLSYVVGANNYWLTLGGTDSSNLRRVVRGGTVEITPCPFVTDTGLAVASITVEDDVATFVYNGASYSVQVVEITPPVDAVEGEIIVADDMGILTIDGVSYTFPVAQTSE